MLLIFFCHKMDYVKHEGEISNYIHLKSNGQKIISTYKKKKFISPEMISEMKQLLADGLLRKEICQRYSISMPTLKKYIG